MTEGSNTDPLTVEGLQAALAAERARIREVEHRAKNSLQLVVSLLMLLGRRSPHEDTRAALKALQHHVSAVAAVHRDFMDAARPDRFDLTRLVRDRATALVQAQGEGAAVRLELDEVAVEPAKAAPLALIASELILNALKHAGADGAPPPEVTVSLRDVAGGFELSVQDDGRGPAAVAAPGFGLTMVRLLCQQVGAQLALEDAQPGLRALVTQA